MEEKRTAGDVRQERGEKPAVNITTIGLALAGNVLSIDGSFLFVFISIFVLIFVLNRTLFKPINRVLDERERLGVGRLAESQQMLVAYEERLAGYEEKLRAARAEAYNELEAARRLALAGRAKAIEGVRVETARLIDEAKSEVSRQALASRQTLEQEARAMASTISSRILNRPVTSGGNQ